MFWFFLLFFNNIFKLNFFISSFGSSMIGMLMFSWLRWNIDIFQILRIIIFFLRFSFLKAISNMFLRFPGIKRLIIILPFNVTILSIYVDVKITFDPFDLNHFLNLVESLIVHCDFVLVAAWILTFATTHLIILWNLSPRLWFFISTAHQLIIFEINFVK